jgi:hypothetical protein
MWPNAVVFLVVPCMFALLVLDSPSGGGAKEGIACVSLLDPGFALEQELPDLLNHGYLVSLCNVCASHLCSCHV